MSPVPVSIRFPKPLHATLKTVMAEENVVRAKKGKKAYSMQKFYLKIAEEYIKRHEAAKVR